MKRNETFTADDGTEFGTSHECTAYEKTTLFVKLLASLTEDQVLAALSRTDLKLAGAFERAGTIISRARRDGGEFKRKTKNGTTETLHSEKP